MKDLILSDEFARYRKRLVEASVDWLKLQLWDQNMNPDFIRGGLEMARVMIRLPERILDGDKNVDRMNRQIQEDLNRIHVELVRKAMGVE